MTDWRPKGNILIVDDEASMRELLQIMLERDGYQVQCAEDGAVAFELLKNNEFDLLISDIQMPKLTGIELLRLLREQDLDQTVLMITAFSSTEEAVEAMKLGAYDYITKPFKNDEIRLVIRNALERKELRRENRELKKQLGNRFSFEQLIGNSEPVRKLISLLERIAPSQANVLIQGESGTGKELVAKALHFNSARKDMPFIAINCGAIPENLLESELFGHEKGAFTGADRRKEGLFEAANGGTVFLDEIGELPMAMQVKLLRVLQEREFRRVGGTKTLPLDIRLLAATNRKLDGAVTSGQFREDLYYRLNVVQIDLPPLRERRADIPLLLDYFCRKRSDQAHLPLSKAALNCLLEYDWPGNIRELENFVERCVVLGLSDQIDIDAIPANIHGRVRREPFIGPDIPDEGIDLDGYLADIEKQIILKAVEKSNGIRTRAAKLLHISFRSIRYRLQKLGLDADE